MKVIAKTLLAMFCIYGFAQAQAPQVISASPPQNQLNVPVSISIIALFDMEMNPATINDSTVIVSGRSSGRHTGTIGYDGPSRTAAFDPVSDFQPGEVVSVVLSSEIAASGGFQLTDGYTWQFTVAADGGSGIFTSIVSYGAGNVPRSVFGCDLDGDGDNDLAVANTNSNNISVLRNNGDGTFQAAVNYGVGESSLVRFWLRPGQ